MSGRGQKGRGGGGRGPGKKFFNNNKSSSNSSNKNKPDTKKVIQDFTYHTGNAKQASEFEATTDFIINHVKETYEYGDDIATSMKDLTLLSTDNWKPVITISTETDKDKKTA
jgi:hypothetical protein